MFFYERISVLSLLGTITNIRQKLYNYVLKTKQKLLGMLLLQRFIFHVN